MLIKSTLNRVSFDHHIEYTYHKSWKQLHETIFNTALKQESPDYKAGILVDVKIKSNRTPSDQVYAVNMQHSGKT